ncbi:MAG: HIRAN domain-containing protein [Fibrobacter sp.]|nr:HIRAN domain-containing protein [Fibrobacter sp.]
MGRELAKKKQELVSIVAQNSLGEIIKPLIREIHLFDTYIAHAAKLKPATLKALREGDRLSLLREESRFDESTIAILNEKKEKLGYIPESDTLIFARLMDAGKILKAKITRIETKENFPLVGIGIYLVDL